MELRGTRIEDATCELFGLWACRLIVTGADQSWLEAATTAACGYGSSIIGCDAEAGREAWLDPSLTPDGRPGAALALFARRRSALSRAVQNRVGQGILTCPTTAVFDGLGEASEHRFDLGRWLRFFGDGHEQSATRHGRDGWVIPVMSGEFFCEATAGLNHALGGAAVFVCGEDEPGTRAAAMRGAAAVAPMPARRSARHTVGSSRRRTMRIARRCATLSQPKHSWMRESAVCTRSSSTG